MSKSAINVEKLICNVVLENEQNGCPSPVAL